MQTVAATVAPAQQAVNGHYGLGRIQYALPALFNPVNFVKKLKSIPNDCTLKICVSKIIPHRLREKQTIGLVNFAIYLFVVERLPFRYPWTKNR